jgi:hypothetical protein
MGQHAHLCDPQLAGLHGPDEVDPSVPLDAPPSVPVPLLEPLLVVLLLVLPVVPLDAPPLVPLEPLDVPLLLGPLDPPLLALPELLPPLLLLEPPVVPSGVEPDPEEPQAYKKEVTAIHRSAIFRAWSTGASMLASTRAKALRLRFQEALENMWVSKRARARARARARSRGRARVPSTSPGPRTRTITGRVRC